MAIRRCRCKQLLCGGFDPASPDSDLIPRFEFKYDANSAALRALEKGMLHEWTVAEFQAGVA